MSMRSVEIPEVGSRAIVLALSRREWRVTNPAKVEQDGTGLVGFVERIDTRFEATRIDAPRVRDAFPSLDQAVASLL